MKPPFAPTTSKDLTAEMNAWLAGLPDGATAELAGEYRVDGVVTVAHPITLVGGTLRADTLGAVDPPRYPKNRCHLLVSGDDVKVQGTKINGPNGAGVYDPAVEFQHGIKVTGHRALIDGVDVREVHGDGVKIAADPQDPPVVGTVVRASSFSVIGRQGISVGDSTDTLLKGNRLTRVARSGIDVEPLGKKDASGQWSIREVVTNLTIDGNQLSQITNAVLANLGGGYVDGLTVINNKAVGEVFTVGAVSPIQGDGTCERRRRYSFTGNSSDTPFGGSKGAMSFVRIDDLKIGQHSQPVKTARTGPPTQWLFTEDCTLVG